MGEFVEFVRDLNRNKYSKIFHKLIDEKIPCAIFLLGNSRENFSDLLNQTRRLGFNLKCLLSTNPEALQNMDIDVFHVKDFRDAKIKCVLSSNDLSDNFSQWFKSVGIIKFNLLTSSQTADQKFDFYMDHLPELE